MDAVCDEPIEGAIGRLLTTPKDGRRSEIGREVAPLDEVTEVPGGIHMKQTFTTEIEDESKPAMVAERLTRLYY